MTHHRTTRRIRPHILPRDGIVEAPSDLQARDRYRVALAAGWRPLA